LHDPLARTFAFDKDVAVIGIASKAVASVVMEFPLKANF